MIWFFPLIHGIMRKRIRGGCVVASAKNAQGKKVVRYVSEDELVSQRFRRRPYIGHKANPVRGGLKVLADMVIVAVAVVWFGVQGLFSTSWAVRIVPA